MRALLVARKALVEACREFQLPALVLLAPLLFLVIAATVYKGSLLVTHPVWVVALPGTAGSLLEELEAQRYTDGRPVFQVTVTADRSAAEAALMDQTATAVVLLAPSSAAAGETPPPVILGDALYPRFFRAGTLLSSLIQRHSDREAGRASVVHLVEEPLVSGGPQTEFDVFAPGIMVFAWLMLIPQTAMLVARETRWRTLRRLRLTRMRAAEFLGGIGLSQMVVASAQVILVLLAALALGFHNQGSVWIAILVGLGVSLSAVGLGLMTACVSENDSQAANTGSTFAMILVFLSGAFFPMPPLTLFHLAGHPIGPFDLFPATHGCVALQQVLTYGCGLRETAFRLGATLVLSALYLAAGVALFRRTRRTYA